MPPSNKKALVLRSVEKVVTLCDMVLVMTVHPGFGGQDFIDDAARKCTRLRQIAGPDVRIEVDGGIKFENMKDFVRNGADILVIGSGIFKSGDPKAEIVRIRQEMDRLKDAS